MFSERNFGIQASFGTACDCENVGVDISVVGRYVRSFKGISFGGIFGNFTESHDGIQSAFIVNEAFQARGIQIGGLNRVDRRFVGLQIGLYNVIGSDCDCVQIGFLNRIDRKKSVLLNFD